LKADELKKKEKTKKSSEKTGFITPEIDPVPSPGQAGGRPLSIAWISDELLAKTQEVWSEAYNRPVSEEEAVEILMNVKHMAEALMEAKRGGGVE